MKITYSFCLLLAFAISLISIKTKGQRLSTIDSIVTSAASENYFEGTVLLADGGSVIYQKSFGYTDASKQTPVGNSTRFGIASITKMFTAIIIMQLVEESKLSLTDNLAELLPGIDIPKSSKITIHHLLLHISGLPNESDLIYQSKTSPEEFVDATLQNKSSRFEQFNYANIDYVLLGMIIESIDGRNWQQSVKVRILDKTGMNDTGFLGKDQYPEDFAYSFSIDPDNNRIEDPLFHIENFYAAGCMYSTAQDLLKLDQAMYGNSLLTEASKEMMFKSYPEYNYSGYSVWTYKYPYVSPAPYIMERRGGILGSNSALVRILSSNKTIIILSNNNRFNPDSFGDKANLKEALIMELTNP
ncbi:serine hydrolase domain-containing protein [Fulvivirga sedimenti]|uniref:Beta-lactamase family protein n=1 Tax=Fulvivirga sedimenti TaxID=2879465 RepID=A0A9X1HS84_9BACT|nr:serine hydrolase domain-containing protein [Fulvivirga sedimenti]MCA6075078.1 beta-lactamase family protein [Fulvivirga sedimenti]MCA6076255.1 beta-lactamase family protein [Fulvivirga sedimenti]MCA6077383.1 beta-lactamase family protein [Fulvivirga sedimenti]